jgi:hypothetical protein
MRGAWLVPAAGWSAAVFGVLGFAASLGHGALGGLPSGLAAPVAVGLLLLGAGAAVAAGRIGREIDRERFDYASDPHATRDEVKLAHREAERRHRVTHTALAAAPVLLGYWLAYEFPADFVLGRAVPAAPLLGFGLGLLWGRRRRN